MHFHHLIAGGILGTVVNPNDLPRNTQIGKTLQQTCFSNGKTLFSL